MVANAAASRAELLVLRSDREQRPAFRAGLKLSRAERSDKVRSDGLSVATAQLRSARHQVQGDVQRVAPAPDLRHPSTALFKRLGSEECFESIQNLVSLFHAVSSRGTWERVEHHP